MYQKNKRLINFLFLVNITIFVLVIFIFQRYSPFEVNLLFLSLFLLMLFTVTELIGVWAGVYAVSLSVIFLFFWTLFFAKDNQPTYYLLAGGYLATSCYYFFVRYLRKRKFKKTFEREKLFRALVNVGLQPVIIKNEKGEVIFSSDSIKEFLGLKKNLPTGKNISEYIHPEDIHRYDMFLTQILEWPNEKKSIELRLKKDGGDYIWARNEAINLLGHPKVKAIVSTWQDITLQKTVDYQKNQLLKNEQEARTMAEKAVRDRDEFLSIASHELKTPLTTILLQLQATLRKILTQSLSDFSGRELLSSLQIAERQSQNLSTLIKDLLNVSLASTGRLTLTKEKLNLSDIVASLSEKYNEEIKLSGCEVRTIIKNREIIGFWDPVRIEQALTNLLMNALKYAKGKKVTLTVLKKNGFGVFKIKDLGKGIPLEMQERIFGPFQRANGDSSIKGLGVGLFITRQIVLSHSGDISVESEVNKGTTFILKLPLAQTKEV